MRKLLSLVIVTLFMSAGSLFAQKKQDFSYKVQWQKVDSLMSKDLPKSAGTIIRDILQNARQYHNQPQIIKAQLFLMVVNKGTKEQADVTNIKTAEQNIAQSTRVVKALWQSITAEMYWHYYQQHRYKILGRTSLSRNASNDVATWSAQKFYQKIGQLYLASVSNAEALQKIPVEQYTPLIKKGEKTRKLRPTLYDLLVFRAIKYFQNTEKGITQPANHFELSGGEWFAPVQSFIKINKTVPDSTSLNFRALQLYQNVLAFHLKKKSSDALIDADLHRLKFVYDNSVSPNKDSFYLQALERLKQTAEGSPVAAEVVFRIVKQKLGAIPEMLSVEFQRRTSKENFQTKRNLPALKKGLENIVARYPKSEGGVHAFNLLQDLQKKAIELTTEAVNVPDKNILTLVSYRNVSKIYLKIYRIPNVYDSGHTSKVKRLMKLADKHPIASLSQSLPGSQDMEPHSVEIKVNALPTGRYLLIASLKPNLKDTQNIVTSTEFQVSDLSLIMRQDQDKGSLLWVLHRNNGQPAANAKLIFWRNKYNRRNGDRYWKIVARKQVNGKGFLAYSGEKPGSSFRMMVISGKDTFCTGRNVGFYHYNNGTEKNKSNIHTFFFTDRSIYRPGQTIYFKGILVNSSDGGRQNEVVPNKKTTVAFYDANHQKVHSLTLTTNEYGSFSGQFTAPEGGLNGLMRIRNKYGSTSISVEEYKRPKFYVDFDTLKGSYALNQSVSVTGFAKAYAGNNVDGAKVKYRVVRRAKFPFYWAFYRWGQLSSPEMEIANGVATTAANGAFKIKFQTIPDRSISPKTLPVFTYTVYADVTDINGETRSDQINVYAGYRSMKIRVKMPETASQKNLDTIAVSSENLNNVFVPTRLSMIIAPLKFPGKVYRKRLWSMPDQFVMTEAEFHKAFPYDAYKHEGDYHYWHPEQSVFEKSFTTTAFGHVAIPKKVWSKAGWYVITFTGKDVQGKAIKEKKYTYVTLPYKRGLSEKSIVATVLKDSYQPGDKAVIRLKTGFKQPYILQNSSLNEYNLAGIVAGKVFNQTIAEANLGGIGFSWLYVYHNRIYTTKATLNVPWNNKDLHLTWATHRNKVLPGSKESWTVTISGNKKDKVAAELLAGMYDASLDAFKPHHWDWNKLFPSLKFYSRWNEYGYHKSNGRLLKVLKNDNSKTYNKQYDYLNLPNGIFYRNVHVYRNAAPPLTMYDLAAAPVIKGKSVGKLTSQDLQKEVESQKQIKPSKEPDIRKNLNETAFFLPQLHTDKNGDVKFTFTLPEALTTWKFMAFAHTKDWETGYLEGTIKTQKDLMVQPNLPRFLRQGDGIVISSKISNLSDGKLTGTAKLQILNALTLKPVNLPFRLEKQQKSFQVAKGQSTTANWKIQVPESMYAPVIMRISATAGNFTDGVQNVLPVVTNRVLVTETLPLSVRGSGTKSFTFDKLLHSDSLMDLDKGALMNHALTVEFTGNPAWYAVQALPYLIEYPYECSEQTFNRFYANALAANIVAQSPKVEAIFNQWKNRDTAALLSDLEKNQELKSALLQETPWVMAAKSETAQKHRIALLFQTHKLAKNLKNSLQKLSQKQLPDGSFSWFKGMPSNRYITQYIVTGMAHLQHLGVKEADSRKVQNILEKALPFLDAKIKEDYQHLKKKKVDLSRQNIGYLQIQYLYMRSYFKDKPIP